jgi:DNA-binding response OmpR family regulator
MAPESATHRNARPVIDVSILLAEGHADAREMYAEFLRFRSLKVIEADTTDAALEAASAVRVVVTGLSVSGSCDAFEMITRLRHDPLTRHLPIIVVSARALGDDRERALQAGGDVFLTKPCLPEDLLTEIRARL